MNVEEIIKIIDLNDNCRLEVLRRDGIVEYNVLHICVSFYGVSRNELPKRLVDFSCRYTARKVLNELKEEGLWESDYI